MTSLINVDQDELILLGEGELDATERESLFRRLDQHPEQWRACALELLDAHCIAESMRTLRIGADADELNVGLADTTAVESQATRQSGKKRNGWSVSPSAIAAALVLVFILGLSVRTTWERGQADRSRNQGGDLPMIDTTLVRGKAQQMLDRLNIGDERLLAIVEIDNEGQSVHVPVINSNTLAQQITQHSFAPVPSLKVRAANRMGWNLTQERQLLAIEDPERGVEVMPIRLMRLKPVGRDLL